MSSLARCALQTGRVCLDVYLEDVSRLGAPTSQLLSDLRRVIYRLVGRAAITETRGDHGGAGAPAAARTSCGGPKHVAKQR